MSKRLRTAFRGAILVPAGVTAILTVVSLPAMLVGAAIYAVFSLDPTDAALIGMGIVFAGFLAAFGAWVGWSDADD